MDGRNAEAFKQDCQLSVCPFDLRLTALDQLKAPHEIGIMPHCSHLHHTLLSLWGVCYILSSVILTELASRRLYSYDPLGIQLFIYYISSIAYVRLLDTSHHNYLGRCINIFCDLLYISNLS